jgi:hypothetical protein
MASNGPAELGAVRFAHADADRIADCLAGPTCGFAVQRTKREVSHWQVRQQLAEAAGACSSSDVFICYFSGHGMSERGNLYLFWDETKADNLWATSIPASDVVEALKHCKAHSKLLVLDCCHAGAVAQMMGMRSTAGVSVKEVGINPENFVVLMASDRLEKAREFEQLQGSFLATYLCRALSDDLPIADKNFDNGVSIEDLRLYLAEQALKHNEKHPDMTVPRPYIFGQLRGDFCLTLTASDWQPHEIELPGLGPLVVIPHFVGEDRVLCLGKHPVTNSQWRNMGMPEPVGEKYVRGKGWVGPFYPWQDSAFSDPDLPVVCVSADAAEMFCVQAAEISSHICAEVRLPRAHEWDSAAFGTIYPRIHPNTWLSRSSALHHKAAAPAAIDRSGVRANVLGISDMIGNVWEWCGNHDHWAQSGLVAVTFTSHSEKYSVRGGSFLDDLSKTVPFISVRELPDGSDTSHNDLGFRFAATVETRHLPEALQVQLSLISMLPPAIPAIGDDWP